MLHDWPRCGCNSYAVAVVLLSLVEWLLWLCLVLLLFFCDALIVMVVFFVGRVCDCCWEKLTLQL